MLFLCVFNQKCVPLYANVSSIPKIIIMKKVFLPLLLLVAVSANAVNKEACIEFIKMLLTDDIQTEFAMNDRFVLNKDALRTGCNEAIAF